MALYKVQHIYHSTTNLPKDDVINTMHFADGDGFDVGAATALAGHVAAAYAGATGLGQPLETMIHDSISRSVKPTIKVFDGDEGGSAQVTATAAGMADAGSAQGMPREVALCASYRTDYGDALEEAPDGPDAGTKPDRERARMRNRLFLGPFNIIGLANGGRPSASLIAACNDLLVRLNTTLANPLYDDMGLVVYSSLTGQFASPTLGWVDNEWDTQRRRGLTATARTTVAL